MDLPISRIKNATLRFADNGDIEVFDNGYNTTLMRLSDNVRICDYVAVIEFFTEEDGRVRKLMKLQSDYVYQTLNRRTIMQELDTKLRDKDIQVLDIGLYYKVGLKNMVGRCKVRIKEDHDTNETLCDDGYLAA